MALTVQEALTEALDDEFRARATYLAVIEAYGGVRPFVNILESEERHIQALLRLCERHGVKLPTDRWASKASAPESLEAACEAAVEAERENGSLYERLIESAAIAGLRDVEETFRRLMAASQENHLPAFERALARERGDRPGREPPDRGRRRRRRYRGGRTAEPGGRSPESS